MTILAVSANTYEYTNQILIYVIYAVSLNLLLGYAGQLSVAHTAFGGVGGYAAGYLSATHGMSFPLAVTIGILAAALLGLLVALPALYLSMEYLILLTLAVSTVVIALAGAIPQLGGTFGLTGLKEPSILGYSAATPSEFFPFLLVFAVVSFLICLRLGDSAFGRVLRGIRDDEVVTRSVGRTVVWYKVLIFSFACGMAGLAGALYAYYNTTVQPLGFGLTESLLIIAMVVVGGTGNLYGSVVGVVLLVLLQPFLDAIVPLEPERGALLRQTIYGGLTVAVLLARPKGLLPEGMRLPAKLRKALHVTDAGDPPGRADGLAAPKGRSAEASADVIVAVEGLSKQFGGIHAARELTIELRAGEITALIGPNGAGKTTVFNLITGRITPDAGRVTLDNTDITGWSPERVARAGMVRSFQDVRVYPRLTALENVLLGVQDNHAERLSSVFLRPLRARRDEHAAREQALAQLQFVGLGRQADIAAADLGFGEQKLVALARILATGAKVILLDEPASGIDTEWVERMLELIDRLRSSGRAICIVEHNLHVIEQIADHVYFMEAGAISAEGTMEDLMGQQRLAEAYFGTL